MTKAKICGITRLEDALLAEQYGAWALGFICAPETRRYLAPQEIRDITDKLGVFVTKVGVFVNQSNDEIRKVAAVARFQAIQLHGHESPEQADELRKDFLVIKAVNIAGPVEGKWRDFPADALLVDGKRPGSGEGYPREWLHELSDYPNLIVAGGLTPYNLQETLALSPYAVDVSSGVESVVRIKEPQKLKTFLSLASRTFHPVIEP